MSEVLSEIPIEKNKVQGRESLPGMRDPGPGYVGEPTGELACSPLASPGGHHDWVCQLKGAVKHGEVLGAWIAQQLGALIPSDGTCYQSDICDFRDSPEHPGRQVSPLSPVAVSPPFPIHKTRAVVPLVEGGLGSLMRSRIRREKRGCCQIMVQEDEEQAEGTLSTRWAGPLQPQSSLPVYSTSQLHCRYSVPFE